MAKKDTFLALLSRGIPQQVLAGAVAVSSPTSGEFERG